MADAPVQSYRERRPMPELAVHLWCVWVQEVPAGAPDYLHRTVPNGGVEIACRVGGLPELVGPQTGPTVELLPSGTTVVGVRFRPGTAPSVLGVPASELVDQAIAGDQLWGTAAVELGERVAAAASPQAAATVLERAVFEWMVVAAEPDPVVGEAVRQLHPWRAREVASLPSALYISERQLRRRCLAAVGFAPKTLHRMLRFQGFLALAQGHHHDPDLALLAAEAGYADQAHLTRESLRLAGRSPRVLLDEAARDCDPAHDHSASYGPLLRSRARSAG